MIRGLIAGVLGLSLLQAITSSAQATANSGAIITFISHGLARYLDPNVPLIPNPAGYDSAPAHLPGTPAPIFGGLIPGATTASTLPSTSNAGPGVRNV
jgi:hypothetical protein